MANVEDTRPWSQRLPEIALLFARLYVGQFFVQFGFAKIQRGYLSGGVLVPQLQQWAASTPHAWYQSWLVDVVIPNEHLFAILVALGETLAGLALLAGALTRFSAAVGIFMVGNYLFAKGWPNPAAYHDKDWIALLLTVLIGNAGQYWGLDGWWRRRRS